MRLAFATGAIATGAAAAGLAAVVVWIVTLVTGSTDPWALAPLVVTGVAVLTALVTYVAEWVVHRRTMLRMRDVGEPWAYRED